jgi:hypothetical protein
MIAITLNKEIDINWLVQQINNEIQRHGTGEDRILYIDIKKIEQTITLEHKELTHEYIMPEQAQDDS